MLSPSCVMSNAGELMSIRWILSNEQFGRTSRGVVAKYTELPLLVAVLLMNVTFILHVGSDIVRIIQVHSTAIHSRVVFKDYLFQLKRAYTFFFPSCTIY